MLNVVLQMDADHLALSCEKGKKYYVESKRKETFYVKYRRGSK